MIEENPYAPPQTAVLFELPDAPKSFGWELVEKSVLVRQSACFPLIDPFTGGCGDRMTLIEARVRYRPRWLLISPILGAAIASFICRESAIIDLVGYTVIGISLGSFVSSVVGRMYPPCTFRLYYEWRTLRKRRILSLVGGSAVLLPAIVMYGSIHFKAGFPGSIFIWAPLLMPSSDLLNRKLRCVRKSGDRYIIHGFSRMALAALAAETSEGVFTEAEANH